MGLQELPDLPPLDDRAPQEDDTSTTEVRGGCLEVPWWNDTPFRS